MEATITKGARIPAEVLAGGEEAILAWARQRFQKEQKEQENSLNLVPGQIYAVTEVQGKGLEAMAYKTQKGDVKLYLVSKNGKGAFSLIGTTKEAVSAFVQGLRTIADQLETCPDFN